MRWNLVLNFARLCVLGSIGEHYIAYLMLTSKIKRKPLVSQKPNVF